MPPESRNAPPAPGPASSAPERGAPAPPPVPDAFQATPNAERYVLQADALRRRQLRAALLYGSSRYWRRRQRVWPAVIVGVILAAVTAGVIVVAGAFQAQQGINEERRQGLDEPAAPLTPQQSAPVVGENASPGTPGAAATRPPQTGAPGPAAAQPASR